MPFWFSPKRFFRVAEAIAPKLKCGTGLLKVFRRPKVPYDDRWPAARTDTSNMRLII